MWILIMILIQWRRKIKKRYFAKKDKGLLKGYDSLLEQNLHQNELADYGHHPDKVNYVVGHTYEPDFVHEDYKNILIEVKGRFRDPQEAAKYRHIRDCNPDKEIIFIFQKPETPMPFAKIRKKCGTKNTHGEWATKNKFRWFTRETFPGVENL